MEQLTPAVDLFVAAPISALVVTLVGIGFWVGYKARDGEVQALKDWITELLKRK